VVGMVVAIHDGMPGIGFAHPAATLKTFIEGK